MKNILFLLLIAVLSGGCAMNLVTGRKQLSLVQESELQVMALAQYNTFLTENKTLNNSNSSAAMVDRVGARISNAITKYYTGKGQGAVLEGYKWEFNTVDSKEVNARWKSGCLHRPVGCDPKRNGACHCYGARNCPSYGIGSQVGAMLPWSRQQKTEADQFGLIFAAMAGYDPREAIPFWQRMSAAGGAKQPEFLSTHPSDDTRMRKLNQFMPEALKYYTGGK